jgi:hypothetical protein
VSVPAASKIEQDDNACHWPVTGSGVDALFCNASRNGSDYPSYCRHHAMCSVAVDQPITHRRMATVPDARAW